MEEFKPWPGERASAKIVGTPLTSLRNSWEKDSEMAQTVLLAPRNSFSFYSQHNGWVKEYLFWSISFAQAFISHEFLYLPLKLYEFISQLNNDISGFNRLILPLLHLESGRTSLNSMSLHVCYKLKIV
jgi:hypothetical protein